MSKETEPAAQFKEETMVEHYEARQNLVVPGRSELYAAMLQMIAVGSERATLVDLGCGRATFSELLLKRFPHLDLILLDFSAAMLAAAERQLKPYAERVSFVHEDLNSGVWHSKLAGEVRGVVSSHAIHHLADKRKRQLYREIYEITDKRGFFINGDLVCAEDPHVNAHFEEVWVDFIFSNVSRTADFQKSAAMRAAIRERHHAAQQEEGDKPARMTDQISWLREVGFQAAFPFWQHFGFAALAAYKDPRELANIER